MVEQAFELKQYLNKDLPAKELGKDKYYKLFVTVGFGKYSFSFPSKLNKHLKIYNANIKRITQGNEQIKELVSEGYFSDALYEEIVTKKLFPIYNLLNDEIVVVRKILNLKKDRDEKISDLKHLESDYLKYTVEITDFFDKELKGWYKKELDTIFLNSIDNKDEKENFRICNYFLHFLNWNNSFYSLYDSTFEMMPSGLKKLENLLSKELQTTIKAYLSYYAHVNILNRIFEKRELGKISTLSVLDWETDIRGIVLKHFEKLFGQSKAKLYIQSLDKLLEKGL